MGELVGRPAGRPWNLETLYLLLPSALRTNPRKQSRKRLRRLILNNISIEKHQTFLYQTPNRFLRASWQSLVKENSVTRFPLVSIILLRLQKTLLDLNLGLGLN